MGAFDILTLACMFYSLTLFVRSYARKRNRWVFDTLERRLEAQVALDRGSPEQEATGRRRSLRELLEILSAPCWLRGNCFGCNL